MVIEKTKDYSNISLSDVKTHLRIYSGDTTYDSELQDLIHVAVNDAESFTQFDLVPNICTLEDYGVTGQEYQINEPDIQLMGITATTLNTDNTVYGTSIIDVTGCSVFKFNQYSIVRFPSSITADVLNLRYSSGTVEVDPQVLHAIKLRVGYYFDADRNEQSTSNTKETKAFQRLLSTKMNLI